MIRNCTLVFDIGKTNIKLAVLNDKGDRLETVTTKNRSIKCKPYLSIDVESIWEWFVNSVRKLSQNFQIEAISISTHGATAALVDLDSEDLILPIMDYEFDDYPDEVAEYYTIRPHFENSYSPFLPAGLNLGKQLFFQLAMLDEDKRKKTTLLFYPNYWSWRLSGIATAEMTSIGCHTDLWDHKINKYSSIIEKLDLTKMLPEIVSGIKAIGTIKPEIAQMMGLPDHCQIYPGVHDSNAAYIPYIDSDKNSAPTVISSGTWSIIMSPYTPLNTLDEEKDMLANIDILGQPIGTARYMGGREFETICSLTGASVHDECKQEDVEDILSSSAMAFPSFVQGCGPCPNIEGKIIGNPKNGKALATVYSALMLDRILSSLQSENDIIIEGSFASNTLLCSVLAALRPKQKVYVNTNLSGIVDGCYLLTQWHNNNKKDNLPVAKPIRLASFNNYAAEWKDHLHRLQVSQYE